jgi:hypothetical protein
MIEILQVTDSTTREELIAHIDTLEEEIEKLESESEDQKQEIKALSLAPEQQNRLAQAADLMADLGRIHNTPYSKAQRMSGY